MKTLADQMNSYSAYHRHPKNRATHFIGVPLVTLALFILLGWLRTPGTQVPLTGAGLFWLVVTIYYFRLDAMIATALLFVTIPMLLIANAISQFPFLKSFGIFLVIFAGGVFFQGLGHYYEGKRPALFDNIWQVFNAPLFLMTEVFFALGLKRDLQTKLHSHRERIHG